MKIGPALDLVEEGRVVRRAAWPEGTTLRLGPPTREGRRGGAPRRYLVISRPDCPFPTPWHATSPDLRAGDWEEVPS